MSDLVPAREAHALVALDEARRQIALARDTRDTTFLADLRNQASAVQHYQRQRTGSREAANDAGEIKVRAERALGQIDNENNPPGRGRMAAPTASISGVTDRAEHTRAAWRKLGDTDDETLENAITKAREEEDGAVTTATVLGHIHRDTPPPPAEATPELPLGVYRTIVIDPPWPMAQIIRGKRAAQPHHIAYATMGLDGITALPLPDLADPRGAHIYLWVTHRFLPAGLSILERWGARYECALTWVKNVGITPFSWMYSTEHVLFARAGGALDLKRKGLRLDIHAPTTGHSAKPDAFYELVREASPEPRLEMFARAPHDGFAGWGAEVSR